MEDEEVAEDRGHGRRVVVGVEEGGDDEEGRALEGPRADVVAGRVVREAERERVAPHERAELVEAGVAARLALADFRVVVAQQLVAGRLVFIRERREPRGDEGAPGQRVGQARGDVVDGRAVRLARRRVVDEAAGAGVPRPAEGDRALDEDDVARAEVARRERAAAACVEIKSSTRLRCARNRTVWTRLFGCTSRTR